ncbi:hypothetical protein EJB05_33534 [Eragrostis curvula]|uniref:Uncharacterized protein n=1 Tax=Eragrostis curvula TaxID=38414 RepID=A0A5J9U1H8_9POAL|nr:hypothetical protein EJB05_33534 [Eragrostis curvula]
MTRPSRPLAAASARGGAPQSGNQSRAQLILHLWLQATKHEHVACTQLVSARPGWQIRARLGWEENQTRPR